MNQGGGERGAAAVLLLGVTMVAVFAAFEVARLGSAATGRARAETAADAAALAAADTLALGRGASAAARAARETARANGARLERCECRGRIVRVTVSVEVRGVVPRPGRIKATAGAELRPICVTGPQACGQEPTE